MELIRVKSRLAQPYAGAFLKKEDRYVTLKHHCFHFDLHVIAKNNKENFRDFRSCSLLYTAVLCMLCYLNQSLYYTIYSSHEYGMSYAFVALLNTGCTKCC